MESRPQQAVGTNSSQAVLAIDIGATNIRIRGCVFERRSGAMHILWTDTGKTGSEEHLRQALVKGAQKLLSTQNVEHIALATSGCPGIVSPDRKSAIITYLGPSKQLDIGRWLEDAGVEKIVLYNDLECGCFGVTATSQAQLQYIHRALEAGIPNIFVIGMPGTGLGIGFWMDDTPHPSEGGHGLVAMMPDDPIEFRIWEGFHQKKPDTMPVYDDIACGKGLGPLAKILSSMPEFFKPDVRTISDISSISDHDLPSRLSQWANDKSGGTEMTEFSRSVFGVFGKFLGRALQMPVLTVMPKALFLGGAIAMANLPWFKDEFLQALHSHRYHAKWLSELPVVLVADPDLNLNGAVEAAKRVMAA